MRRTLKNVMLSYMKNRLGKFVMLQKSQFYNFSSTLQWRYERVKRYPFIEILSRKVSCYHAFMMRNVFPQIILLLKLRPISLSIYVNTSKNLKASVNNICTSNEICFWFSFYLNRIKILILRVLADFAKISSHKNYWKTI